MNQFKRSTLAVVLASLFATSPGWANELEEMEVVRQTTINLIQALVDKGVLTQDAANDLIKQAEKSARKKVATAQVAENKVVRVPYVPESVKREIRDQVKQEVVAQAKAERWGDVNAVPEWVERLHWEGDLRVRAQRDSFGKENFVNNASLADVLNVSNTSDQQDRLRVRARLGLLAKVTPGVSAGFRLTTGNTSDPVSTNQTLGTYENKYTLVFDRAYLKIDPAEWLSVSGGRMPNPYFSSDLVWDDDINFEGVATTFQLPASSNSKFRPFMTLGAFPLESIEQTPDIKARDKWFWGAQAGLDWRLSSDTRVKVGAAYYDFKNVEGIASPIATPNIYARTAPLFRQKGNSVFDIDPTGTSKWALASKFQLLNFTGSLDLAHFDPVHVILSGDYVKNIGFKQSEIFTRTQESLDPKVKGWQGRVTVGMPVIQQRHDWQAHFGYRRLDRDAVLDAFTDSDFHLGGTDTKGYFVGASYGLDKNTWLSMRYMSADQIVGLPLAIDVLQVDLNAKF